MAISKATGTRRPQSKRLIESSRGMLRGKTSVLKALMRGRHDEAKRR